MLELPRHERENGELSAAEADRLRRQALAALVVEQEHECACGAAITSLPARLQSYRRGLEPEAQRAILARRDGTLEAVCEACAREARPAPSS